MKKVFFISVLSIFTMCFCHYSYAQGKWTGNINFFYGFKTLDSGDWSGRAGDLTMDDITYSDGTPVTMADWLGQDTKLVSLDKAKEFGISGDFGLKSWPVCLAVGFFKASDDDNWVLSEVIEDYYSSTPAYDVTFTSHAKLEVSTDELRVGIKKIFELSEDFRTYIAGGLAWVNADVDLPYGINVTDPYVGVTNYKWLTYKYNESDSAIGYWLSGGTYWTFAQNYNIGVELAYSKANIDFGDGFKGDAGGFHYGLFAGFHW